MRVTVTQADIARGQPINDYKCPVARAIRRALGGRVHVFVSGHWGIEDRAGGQRIVAQLPPKADRFVTRFDTLGPDECEPFSFTTRRPR